MIYLVPGMVYVLSSVSSRVLRGVRQGTGRHFPLVVEPSRGHPAYTQEHNERQHSNGLIDQTRNDGAGRSLAVNNWDA